MMAFTRLIAGPMDYHLAGFVAQLTHDPSRLRALPPANRG